MIYSNKNEFESQKNCECGSVLTCILLKKDQHRNQVFASFRDFWQTWGSFKGNITGWNDLTVRLFDAEKRLTDWKDFVTMLKRVIVGVQSIDKLLIKTALLIRRVPWAATIRFEYVASSRLCRPVAYVGPVAYVDQTDQKFRDKFNKIDDRKRTYNIKNTLDDLKIVFYNIEVFPWFISYDSYYMTYALKFFQLNRPSAKLISVRQDWNKWK